MLATGPAQALRHLVRRRPTQLPVLTMVTGYSRCREHRGLSCGALTDGFPQHAGGISTTHPGLAYVGIEFQRSYASNMLRGVHRDAEYVARAIAAHVRDAGALVRP
jgi:hypothetical protein